MSGLKKYNSTLQSCTPEMVGCPFQERAGYRAMGSSLFTALDRARHSWERRQHVGRGGAGLDISWNMVGVRKDKHLQRLVELCTPEGFGQLLKHKWTFQSPSSELQRWNEWVPPRTRSTVCALSLWCVWSRGTRRKLLPGVAGSWSDLPTGYADPPGECCTLHTPGKGRKEVSQGQYWIVQQEIVHLSSLTLCHFPVTCSYYSETSCYRSGLLNIYLNIPKCLKITQLPGCFLSNSARASSKAPGMSVSLSSSVVQPQTPSHFCSSSHTTRSLQTCTDTLLPFRKCWHLDVFSIDSHWHSVRDYVMTPQPTLVNGEIALSQTILWSIKTV